MHTALPQPSGRLGTLLMAALCGAALCTWMLTSPAPAAAQSKARPKAQKITLDFDNAPIEEVIRFYANLTQRNFIIAKDLGGKKITILAPSPVTVAEAWKALLAALSMNGMTAVKDGKFIRIVEASSPAGYVAPIGAQGAGAGNMGTHHIPLKHASVDAIVPVLEQLASPQAKIIPDPRTNSLIIVERPAQVRRLKKLIKALDKPGEQPRVWVYQLQHADAAEVARIIGEMTR